MRASVLCARRIRTGAAIDELDLELLHDFSNHTQDLVISADLRASAQINALKELQSDWRSDGDPARRRNVTVEADAKGHHLQDLPECRLP